MRMRRDALVWLVVWLVAWEVGFHLLCSASILFLMGDNLKGSFT
jgi:hypothetical protein